MANTRVSEHAPSGQGSHASGRCGLQRSPARRVVRRPQDTPGEAARAPLGTHAKSASPLGTPSLASERAAGPAGAGGLAAGQGRCLDRRALPEEPGALRFLLQAGSRDLNGDFRVWHCLRTPFASEVEVWRSEEQRRALFRGVQTCGSVWVCPVCAARITEHRRRELARLVAEWKSLGGRVVLVTYTIRHKAGDDLAASVDGLLCARKRLRSGKAAEKWRRLYGFTGSVRALEVTHGANGWHPHLHELLFIAAPIGVGDLEGDLRERWAAVVAGAGLRDVNEHGIDVQDTDEAVADYVAKFGHEPRWTEAHELAKSATKKGRQGSRSPFGLLEDYVLGDEEAGRLFRHYSLVFKGRQQLVGLGALLSLLLPDAEEVTDEEIVGDARDYNELMAILSLAEWRVILANDARAEVLQLAAAGDRGGLVQLVADLFTAAFRSAAPSVLESAEDPVAKFMPRALRAGEAGEIVGDDR